MTRILSVFAQVLVAAGVGLAIAYCIVWGLDEEERQVRAGKKDPSSTILPVVTYETIPKK